MIVTRVEKHILKQNNVFYSLIDDFCFKAKNLYNHANYIVRQAFCSENKWVRYRDLDLILKNDIEYSDYKEMPTAQSAQQILRLLDKNWSSFFKAIKDWGIHKEKYLGKPKFPKYKSKNGREILILTNQNVKLKEGILKFPKTFKGFNIIPKFIRRTDFVSFQQVRFLSRNKYIVVEIVYNIEIPDVKIDNNKCLSIDIGVDNLVTIVNNFNEIPVIINGKGLKSINQYYNKKLAYYRSITKIVNKKDYSNRQNKLTMKRNAKILDYIHKASRYVVNYAKRNDVSVIVIGYNKEWKQNSAMCKQVNQTFIQIPFSKLIDQIKYKAEEFGIDVILTEESYTSGTSFLDNEQPIKEYYNKSRRIHRGLFKSNIGVLVNSDVNGAFQIMKKVFPKAFVDGIEGLVFNPVKVGL